MNIREILTKNTTIYFLNKLSPNGGELFYKVEWNKDGGWDLYTFYNLKWQYEDNICDESVLLRADEHKVLLELDF